MPRRSNGHHRPARIHIYRTYPFGGKDPVIPKVLALQEEVGMRQGDTALIAGLSPHTPGNWRKPDGVRRPQFASIAAFAAALGYDIEFKRRRVKTDVETELVQAAKERAAREKNPDYRPRVKEYEFT